MRVDLRGNHSDNDTVCRKDGVKTACKRERREQAPRVEAGEGKLDAAAARSFPGFCLPYAKKQDTCGTHQVRQKNTAANSSSYRKGSIIGFVCSLKVFAI